MGLISYKCPNCSSDVVLDEYYEKGVCKYCGTQLYNKDIIDKGINVTKEIEKAEKYIKIGTYGEAVSIYNRILAVQPFNYDILLKLLQCEFTYFDENQIYIKRYIIYDQIVKVKNTSNNPEMINTVRQYEERLNFINSINAELTYRKKIAKGIVIAALIILAIILVFDI